MSQLVIRSGGKSFKMNVTSFSAPLFGNVSSAQTKTLQQHFPVRANQPSLQFSVIFSSEKEYEEFGDWVRKIHKRDIDAGMKDKTGVTLWWPQYEMDNWTGIISQFDAGATKFNWAPRASFTVDLVDSWVARKTSIASIAAPFASVFQDTMLTRLFLGGFTGFIEDTFLRLPTSGIRARETPNVSLPADRLPTGGFPQ